jgi:hypothetical protein
MLDNAYIFPAAARLALYRDVAHWAVMIEVLGFSPKAGEGVDRVVLDLYGFGNCLRRPPGLLASLHPITASAPLFEDPWPGTLRDDVRTLILRGREMRIPRAPRAYAAAGVTRRRADAIYGFEVLRVLVPRHRDQLLAAAVERRAHLPADLPVILQLDDWHHPDLADDEWPGQTETFRQLADVLATGELAHYTAPEPPNTHWQHWPHGGDGVIRRPDEQTSGLSYME